MDRQANCAGVVWQRRVLDSDAVGPESSILDHIEGRVAEVGGFDLSLPWNDQNGVLMEEKDAALEHLMSERQKVLDHDKGHFDQREQLQILTENL